ncbi:MAG: MerR family transcriptional regulator, partial [Burkholderiales bacterium]
MRQSAQNGPRQQTAAKKPVSTRGDAVSDPSTEYSIQEVSEMLAIPIQKLRRWDEQGVLVASRTHGGHR